MSESRHFGVNSSADPDDAPELLAAFFRDAEIREGDTIIRRFRGPGRPRSDHPKQQVTVRLDADLLTRLRGTGRGWQGRLNDAVRAWMDAQPGK